jgi:outer membrane protein assembly factor BamA
MHVVRGCTVIGAVLLALSWAAPARAQAPSDTAAAAVITFVAADSSARGMAISAYPYAYYTPETELAFGAGGIITTYLSDDLGIRPSKLVLSAYYTTTKQYSVSLNPEAYLTKNRYFFGGKINFKHAVDKYFGIGNDSPELGTELYEADRFGIEIDAQAPAVFALATRSGLYYELQQNEIVNRRDNPYLASDSLPGSSGGTLSGAGLTLLWDTRDQIFSPSRGNWARVRLVAYSSSLGSDFTYTQFEVDTRSYLPAFGDDILAVQAYFNGVSGAAPFHRVPGLGGAQRMRGYYEGRFRDNVLVTFQTEYRKHLRGRFGMVVFLGAGEVAPETWRLTLDQLHYSYGAGLRFLFNQRDKVNLRVDLGFGDDTSGVYFGVEEAF